MAREKAQVQSEKQSGSEEKENIGSTAVRTVSPLFSLTGSEKQCGSEEKKGKHQRASLCFPALFFVPGTGLLHDPGTPTRGLVKDLAPLSRAWGFLFVRVHEQARAAPE